MYRADLAAELLTIHFEARRPKASCHRRILKNVDFNVGNVKRFTLDQWRLNRRNPLVLIYLLAMRKRAGEIIAVHALKVSAIVQLDGTRRFSFETHDLLPLQFGICSGFRGTAVNARLLPGLLRLPRGDKDEPDCQCHRARNFDHAGVPPFAE
jgi:hypothetical protein